MDDAAFVWGLRLGLALLLSDLVHHFLVLKFATGHHHFDILYPGSPLAPEDEPAWE